MVAVFIMDRPQKIPEKQEPCSRKTGGWQHIPRAFSYSVEGIGSAFKHELAFRVEVAFAVILVPATFLFPLSLIERLILVSSILLVLVVELLNSGIEAVVDDVSLRERPLAKRAKDMGSAAVFCSLLNLAVCWFFILLPHLSRILGSAS